MSGTNNNSTVNRLEIYNFTIDWRSADNAALFKQPHALRTLHVVLRTGGWSDSNAKREDRFTETGRALEALKYLIESVLPDVEVITELCP